MAGLGPQQVAVLDLGELGGGKLGEVEGQTVSLHRTGYNQLATIAQNIQISGPITGTVFLRLDVRLVEIGDATMETATIVGVVLVDITFVRAVADVVSKIKRLPSPTVTPNRNAVGTASPCCAALRQPPAIRRPQ